MPTATTIRLRPSQVLAQLGDTRKPSRLASELLEAGHPVEDVVEDIAATIDAAVDYTALGLGAVGSILETVDGLIIRLVAGIIVSAARKRAAKSG